MREVGRKLRTVSVWGAHYASHAHLRRALDEAVGDEAIRVGDARERTGDGEDAVVHARDDFAHAGADACLVTQVGDILASLANDDASFLGGDNGTQSDLCLGVLFLGARVVVGVEAAYLIGEVVDAGVNGGRGVFGGHGDDGEVGGGCREEVR